MPRRIKGSGGYIASAMEKGGKWAGGRVGHLVENLLGAGDYRVDGTSGLISGQVPTMHNESMSIRFSHREYLTDISSSTLFNISSWEINPGLASTFPFLSSLADSFEKYRFHGLAFYYKSTSAVALNSTNTALGTVCMATNYDITDPIFSTKQQMESTWMATSGPPASSQLHGVECAKKMESIQYHYVRSGDLHEGADKAFYDIGRFNIATIGQQATSNIGELWVTYDVELIFPRLVRGGTGQSVMATVVSWDSANWTAGSYLGAPDYGHSIKGKLGVEVVGDSLIFPAHINTGNYLVVFHQRFDTEGVIVTPTFTISNGTVGNSTTVDVPFGIIGNGGSAAVFGANNGISRGGTNTVAHVACVVTVNAPSEAQCTITLSGGTKDGLIATKGQLHIMEYPAAEYGLNKRAHLVREPDDVAVKRLAEECKVPLSRLDDYSKFFWTYRNVMGVAPSEQDVEDWMVETMLPRSLARAIEEKYDDEVMRDMKSRDMDPSEYWQMIRRREPAASGVAQALNREFQQLPKALSQISSRSDTSFR